MNFVLLLILALLVCCPILIALWSVRVSRRWAGRWRFAPVAPLLALAYGGVVTARGFRRDPMGHSGWALWLIASVALATVATIALTMFHNALTRPRNGG